LTGNASGPVALLFFAILGWLMTRFDFPVVATVIGLMLGDLVESELIRSYQISGGDLAYLFERPVAIVFLLLLLASLATPLLRRFRRRRVEGALRLAEER
jgi:putative tricarboxylic transport membrane protein